MSHSEDFFRSYIEEELHNIKYDGRPNRLYDPIRYMMSIGGKRLRPSLLLMSHELFGGNYASAISPALGIEVFHNFTLLHDDIMDRAPLRRSKETVHKKWNSDIAILSGDTMFVKSCQLMMNVKAEHLNDIMEIFFKTAIRVCEGQQLDMDFESDDTITIDDYLNMIEFKTASLIGCSTKIGAICADAEKNDADHIYEFGKNLGIAFQLHDDILDVYGDTEKFGKQVGGDILANKKTYLLLTALQKASSKIKSELQHWLGISNQPEQKINAIVSIYETLEVKRHATQKMEQFFSKAIDELDAISVPAPKKEPLLELAERLMIREK